MERTRAFPPWQDLPETLAELVLECLPLVDYIRFAAVCPKWMSIQRGHRLRHAPHPPPMAKQLPWLAPILLNPNRELKVYSPSDRKFYTLAKPSNLHKFRCLPSCRGWLLLLESNFGLTPTSKQPLLFNPITAVQIPLPSLSLTPRCHVMGTMSALPMDPNCIVLLVFGSCAFMYRLNDHCAAGWTIVQLTPLQRVVAGSAVYCGGKFYCSEIWEDKLYVIDPFLQKVASQLVMRYPYGAKAHWVSLQEIGGELFSVLTFSSGTHPWYRVFKADLSGQEWVRVETLGDHALFYYDASSVYLLPADVGCKRNSIYARRKIWYDVKLGHEVFMWGASDLGTGDWTEEGILHGDFGPWFLPTLDSANPSKVRN